MRNIKNNKELFNALGSILYARGIEIEYIDGKAFVGGAINEDQICSYVRPSNGMRFNFTENEIKEIFTPINIDGYQFTYEDFLPPYNQEGIISPELILFSIKKGGKKVQGCLAF